MLPYTVGPWLVVNHKRDEYASTALTLVNVTNTTKLHGGEEEKEMLVFVYVFWCVVVIFFQYRFNVKNTRASSFHRCFTILHYRECGIISYTLSYIYMVEKTVMLNFFLNSFGT